MFDAFILFLFWLFGIYGLMSILLELSALLTAKHTSAKPVYVIDCDRVTNPEEEVLRLLMRLAGEKGASSGEIWLLSKDPSALPASVRSKATAVISKEKYDAIFT